MVYAVLEPSAMMILFVQTRVVEEHALQRILLNVMSFLAPQPQPVAMVAALRLNYAVQMLCVQMMDARRPVKRDLNLLRVLIVESNHCFTAMVLLVGHHCACLSWGGWDTIFSRMRQARTTTAAAHNTNGKRICESR
jgi:hypothetical protein